MAIRYFQLSFGFGSSYPIFAAIRYLRKIINLSAFLNAGFGYGG